MSKHVVDLGPRSLFLNASFVLCVHLQLDKQIRCKLFQHKVKNILKMKTIVEP